MVPFSKDRMKFRVYQQKFSQALTDEIETLRKSGGKKVTIFEGLQVGRFKSKYLYSFSTDTEIKLPDDTPIDFHYQNHKYNGQLISIHGFDLLIAIKENFGKEVKLAKISTEPWYLHKELLSRLDSAIVKPNANRHLAELMLADCLEISANNASRFEDFRPRIEAQLGQSIVVNQAQSDAITHVLQYPVSYIWGPPGTGKTSTLGLTLASLVHSGQSVLLLAHSNTAVDTAMNSAVQYLIASSYYREGLMLRYGIPSLTLNNSYENIDVRGIAKNQNPRLIQRIQELEAEIKAYNRQARLLRTEERTPILTAHSIEQLKIELQSLRQLLKEKESQLVTEAMVVGCTFSKAAIAEEIFNRQFDAVIIDEASMAYIPHCAYAATLAKKRIALFGDFNQLGPISSSETESACQWLQRDIYAAAGITQRKAEKKDERLVMLTTQYRMHPEIAHIPNDLFYGRELINGETIAEQTVPITQLPPSPGNALVTLDLSDAYAYCLKEKESHSRFNPISALIAVKNAFEIKQNSDVSMGIITPYQAQARLINQLIKEIGFSGVVSSTVHRFQGSEKDVILFDATDSIPQSKVGKLLQGGKESTVARLANVAISRAQGKFISLINYSYIRGKQDSFSIFRKFCDRLYHHSEVIPFQWYSEALDQSIQEPLPNILSFASPIAAQAQIHSDLEEVEERIAMDWPTQVSSTRHFSLHFLKTRELSWILRGPYAQNLAKNFKNTRVWKTHSFSVMGAIAIDDILWLYTAPDRDAPVFRIALPKTNKLLTRFMEIVPTELEQTAKTKIQTKKELFGFCEICEKPLMPILDQYQIPRLSCVSNPESHRGRKMKVQDATLWADLMQQTCPKCHSAMKGNVSRTNGGLYLVCSSSKCRESSPLEI